MFSDMNSVLYSVAVIIDVLRNEQCTVLCCTTPPKMRFGGCFLIIHACLWSVSLYCAVSRSPQMDLNGSFLIVARSACFGPLCGILINWSR